VTLNINVLLAIDSRGMPSEMEIKKISCPEMNPELIRLIENSPKWNVKNIKVSLNFQL